MKSAKILFGLVLVALIGFAVAGILYAQTAAIAHLTQITNDKEIDLYPSASPDGKMIVFESYMDTVNGYGKNFDIVSIDDKGQKLRMTTDKEDDNNPAWMGDQKGILFDSMRFDKRAVWIKSMVAGGETKLSRGKTMDFDAHGNPKSPQIVFTALDKKKDITMEKDGERWRKFNNEKKMPYIWIVNADGSSLKQIIKGINPQWSPDGQSIVFSANQTGDYNIYVIRPDGSGFQQLTSRTDTDIEPCWSPDGDYICFVSNVHKNWNLWMMKADGTGLTQLTDHKAFDGGPSWGKDGFIYFHTDRSGNWDIWKFKPSGYKVNPWFDDKDKDGIKDKVDACPEKPEDKDSFEDEDGCPDLDNDHDEIPDDKDECPNEAENKNGYKDEDGCPDKLPIPKSQIIHGVSFRGATANLTPESYPILQNLAATLKKVEGLRVEIRVHTDDRGSESYNQRLSQKRADAVRLFLMQGGVDASMMTAVGYGESQPVASNNTAAGRAKNRRVEVFRLDN